MLKSYWEWFRLLLDEDKSFTLPDYNVLLQNITINTLVTIDTNVTNVTNVTNDMDDKCKNCNNYNEKALNKEPFSASEVEL